MHNSQGCRHSTAEICPFHGLLAIGNSTGLWTVSRCPSAVARGNEARSSTAGCESTTAVMHPAAPREQILNPLRTLLAASANLGILENLLRVFHTLTPADSKTSKYSKLLSYSFCGVYSFQAPCKIGSPDAASLSSFSLATMNLCSRICFG